MANGRRARGGSANGVIRGCEDGAHGISWRGPTRDGTHSRSLPLSRAAIKTPPHCTRRAADECASEADITHALSVRLGGYRCVRALSGMHLAGYLRRRGHDMTRRREGAGKTHPDHGMGKVYWVAGETGRMHKCGWGGGAESFPTPQRELRAAN